MDPLTLESRNDTLEANVSRFEAQEKARLEAMEEQVLRLSEGMRTLRVSYDYAQHQHMGSMNEIDSYLDLNLKVLEENWLDHEGKSLQLCEKELGALRDATIGKDSGWHKDKITSGKVGDEIYKLYKETEAARKNRITKSEEISKKLDKEFTTLREAIEEETRVRLEGEHDLFKALEDVCGEIDTQIQREKSTRKASECRLVQLLEDTCSQFEINALYET